jgi:hypothetical protein
VVERKDVEVDAAHVDDAGENKLAGEVGNFLVETNNLLVETRAVNSALATEDEENRLAGSASGGLRLRVVDDPGRRLVVGGNASGKAKGEQGGNRPGFHWLLPDSWRLCVSLFTSESHAKTPGRQEGRQKLGISHTYTESCIST